MFRFSSNTLRNSGKFGRNYATAAASTGTNNHKPNLYESHQEQVLFTKPFSKLYESRRMTPSFHKQALTLKNAPSRDSSSLVQSWEKALQSDVVRANIVDRWGLKELSTIQKAILSMLREQGVKNAPKLSQIEALNYMNEMEEFGQSKSDYVKKLLTPRSESKSKVAGRFAGSNATRDEDSHVTSDLLQREHQKRLDPSADFEMVVAKLKEQVQSEQDFYIQADDHSGKLTAVLSLLADELLTKEPELSPEPKDPPSIEVIKSFPERERCHPRAIIVTASNEESHHAHRIAQRAFARSKASVEVSFWDEKGKDFLEKGFTKGANVLVMDINLFRHVVNRGWVSARDLSHIVIDDLHKISHSPGATSGALSSLFVHSTWLGPTTKRIALSSNNADHTEHARDTILRDGYVSIMTNASNDKSRNPIFHMISETNVEHDIAALPDSSLIVAKDMNSARQLQAFFQFFGTNNVVAAENKSQFDSNISALSGGKIRSMIIPESMIQEIDREFPHTLPIMFYNYLDTTAYGRLNKWNGESNQKIRCLLTPLVTDAALEELKDYCHLLGVELDKPVWRMYLDYSNQSNFKKNFHAENYVQAKLLELSSRQPDSEYDMSLFPEYTLQNFQRVVKQNAIRSERLARMEKLRKQSVSRVSKRFRKSPAFREFFKLNILNDVEKSQYQFIEKTIFNKNRYTVQDISEALRSFNVEWSSPATLLQKKVDDLKLSLNRSAYNPTFSAVKQFDALRPNTRMVKHVDQHVADSIERYQTLEKLIPQFESLLSSEKLVKALDTLPRSSESFSQWYDQLDSETAMQLNDVADVWELMRDGIEIPSAQAQPNEVSEQFARMLQEVRDSPDYVKDWEEYNEQVLTEVKQQVNIADVNASSDPKEKAQAKALWEKLANDMVWQFPLLAKERELEEALVLSQYESNNEYMEQ